jgi:DNA-binding MarR family transcriptional regulator
MPHIDYPVDWRCAVSPRRPAAHRKEQWRLLVRLVKDEGAPQARLAEILEIEPISVSRLLDRMEAGGCGSRGSRTATTAACG